MKNFETKYLFILLVTVFLISWKPAGNTEIRNVDLVFCIDLSASTNGILNDVRNRMWNIANGILQKNEMTNLRIAVVGYGRPSFGGSHGFAKVISDLNNDFDQKSYDLFQLRAMIEKGDQFVPHALFETYKQLRWSKEPGAEKIVFLIGNGSVYTGSINLADICEEYKKNNIKINTVFITQRKNILNNISGYRNIARETGGSFSIMKPSPKAVIGKPSGDALRVLHLNDSLNSTFMFYSKEAEDRRKYLLETDKNSFKMGEEYFKSRLLYKASKHYNESNIPFDLTGYIMKYNKMPARINLVYLSESERTMNISLIEDRARKKAIDRTRLNDEIKNLFRRDEKNSATPPDSLLDGFVLGNLK